MTGLLDGTARGLLEAARSAVLATVAPDGSPRLVPVCFALDHAGDPARPRLYIPLDEKPKAADDPHDMARVRDIVARPRVALLVHAWDEDWTRLAWLRLSGIAALVEPPAPGMSDAEHAAALRALRVRYRQYGEQGLERRPLIRVALDRARSWRGSQP